MRLRARLILIITAAAVGPIGVLGLGASQLAGQELEQRVDTAQGRDAEYLGLSTSTWLDAQLGLLSMQVRSVPVASLEGPVLLRFQQLVYQQTSAAGIVTLTDDTGRDVSPPVYLSSDGAAAARRPAVGPARVEQLRAALPIEQLARASDGSRSGAALGAPYLPLGADAPVVPVAVAVPRTALVVGVELGLRRIHEEVVEFAEAGVNAALLDRQGTAFIDGPDGFVSPPELTPLLGTTAVSVHFRQDGVGIRAATAPVRGTDWTVVVAAPAEDGARAVQGIQARTGFLALVAAALSIGMGFVWAGRLAEPVQRLRDAAMAVAEGAAGRTVEPAGDEELAELGRTFNHMSTQLQADAAEISAKNAEIEAFNSELQSRVEARTAQLRDAQEQLLQTARLAAVGEMGAGLAHELNNPIAGILGLTQLLRRRVNSGPDAALLESLENEARRCSEIVSSLVGFSQELPASPATDADAIHGVDIHSVLVEVLALVAPPLRQRGVDVDDAVPAGLRARVPRAALGQAAAHLLTSVRAAARGGGRVRLCGAAEDATVELRVLLTGPDLRLGGDDWRAAGLGLWAARRALDEAGGRLVEPAAPDGEALEWRIVLPRGDV